MSLKSWLGLPAFLQPKRKPEPHYVTDYRAHVKSLVASNESYDEAMSLAVGGHYEALGDHLLDVLLKAGLAQGHSIVDVGCGSGRLPAAITRRVQAPRVDYLGTDVVQELLDYASTKSRPEFRFQRCIDLKIPAPDAAADFVTFFSVFTHLRHEESYIYLAEAVRVLKPSGKVVASFLEFGDEAQWPVFEGTVAQRRNDAKAPMNVFTERNMYALFARKLGFRPPAFLPGGQTIVILEKT